MEFQCSAVQYRATAIRTLPNSSSCSPQVISTERLIIRSPPGSGKIHADSFVCTQILQQNCGTNKQIYTNPAAASALQGGS